jgi:hypothetical protein
MEVGSLARGVQGLLTPVACLHPPNTPQPSTLTPSSQVRLVSPLLLSLAAEEPGATAAAAAVLMDRARTGGRAVAGLRLR